MAANYDSEKPNGLSYFSHGEPGAGEAETQPAPLCGHATSCTLEAYSEAAQVQPVQRRRVPPGLSLSLSLSLSLDRERVGGGGGSDRD